MGHGWPPRNMCYHTVFRRYWSNPWAPVRGSQKLGDTKAQPLGTGWGCPATDTLLPHTWYPIKFGRCRSSHFDVGMGPKYFWDAGAMPLWDVGDDPPPLETCYSIMSYCANFSIFDSNHTSIIIEIPKNWPPGLPSHLSRSLERTQGDRQRQNW